MINQNIFSECEDVASVKKLYRKLAHKYHPDKEGGNLQDMQELNGLYLQALKGKDNEKVKDEHGKEHVYKYNKELEQDMIEKINQAFSKGVDKKCDMVLIGSWLWFLDTKKEDKALYKELSLRWSPQRQAWYYRKASNGYRRASKQGISGIAAQYGAHRLVNNTRQLER